MYVILMVPFVLLCIFLAIFVLIQQGKGDLGLGSMSGSQMLFGGSGGQSFFEKATWAMGALFIFGSLGLAILKTKEHRASILEGVTAPQKPPMPMPQLPQEAGVQEMDDDMMAEDIVATPVHDATLPEDITK